VNETTTAILNMLRDGDGYVSGRGISARLGLSRTAVWKHVAQLRALGYVIQSGTNKGYRLHSAPNTPLPCEVQPQLHTQRIGRSFHFVPTTESTNLVASRMAAADAADGLVVAADTQTNGRGRLARTWFSPPGVNIYASVLIRPRVEPAVAPQVALLTALAVVRALREVHPELDAGIKWPNDVYLSGRKVAGILCEMSAEVDYVHHLVVGIGMNVNMPRDQFPACLAEIATSLRAETGTDFPRATVLAAILNEMEPV